MGIVGDYFVAKEGDTYRIRRWMGDGSQPRYPRSKYKHLKTKAELDAFCIRLNHEEGRKAKERVEIESAFIPQSLLDAFRDSLSVSYKNEKDFNYQYKTVLKVYFLNFFVTALKLPDPRQWLKHQEVWGAALVGKSEHILFETSTKQSTKTLKTIIQMANRFMQFLNQKLPEEYPLVKFKPLSKNAMKEHEAKRKLGQLEPVGRFIDLEHWIQINAKLPPDIAPYIRLMYYYGLRRAESLGFTTTDAVKHGHLNVNTQLQSLSTGIESLKDKEQRATPHWYCSAERAYRLVSQSLLHKLHPDTLSERWDEVRIKLNFSFNLHDFRRTFITRALRDQKARDVQMAVGHADLRTTMRYAQDDRELDDRIWIPPAS